MRQYVEPCGATFSLNVTGSDVIDTELTPALKELADLASYSGLDLELRILDLAIAEGAGTEVIALNFETSMQNDENAPEYWSVLPDYETPQDLRELSAPRVLSLGVERGLLRYLRWRITIPTPTSGDPIELKAVFQLRGFGRYD